MADIVIGSGPAGVSAAMALTSRGQDVTMLDAGGLGESDREALRMRLASVEPENWQADDVEAYTAAPGPESPHGTGAFGTNFQFRDSGGFYGPEGPPGDLGLRASFARGGLSNGWGSAVLPYREEDLRGWPLQAEDLKTHYEAIQTFLPVAAEPDALAHLFPTGSVSADTGLPLSSQASGLLERLRGLRDRQIHQDVVVGQSRVAVADGCRKCGLCLYGCPYGLIYNAASTLEQLRRTKGFNYLGGYYVTHFEEMAHGVGVRARNLATGREENFTAGRLFIAGGVLPTTQLVLSSLDRTDEPVTMLDSQHFFIPMLHSWRSDVNPATEDHHTLTQIFMEIIDEEVESNTVHVQVYTHNDQFQADIAARFRFLSGLLSPLAAAFSRRLMVAQGFLHSDVSSAIQIRLQSGGQQESLEYRVSSNPQTLAAIVRVRKRLSAVLRKVGLYTLPPLTRVEAAGSSFHCGGTFPMRHIPQGLESDLFGRPAGLQRVFLVDASVFPSIPATTITFAVMANAHRIATNAPVMG